MSELLREIEEDIRNERMQRLWNSFGKLMVRLSLVVIAATVGVVLWQQYREEQAAGQTALLIRGVDRLRVEDYHGAIEAFDAVENGGSPYRALALLRKAAAQQALHEDESAEKTYRMLAQQETPGASLPFVELAKLLAAKDSDVPLNPAAGSPFYHSQGEIRAWQLLAGGKKDAALEEFAALRDDASAPRGIRARAATVLEYMAPAAPEAKADES